MALLQPIEITSSTLTVTKKAHNGATFVCSRAAGIVFTLPASEGKGAKFRWVVHTTITSNALTVQVANSTDIMYGVAIQAADGGSTSNVWESGASDDTISMNGTTTGGIRGDYIEVEDVKSGFWAVKVVGSATGTEATPFSAAV